MWFKNHHRRQNHRRSEVEEPRREQPCEVLDPDSALASVGGDADFLRDLAGLVLAAFPTLLGNISDALAAGDLAAVESGARLAKTAAESVSAGRVYMSALQLQMMSMQRNLEGAKQVSRNLEGEVAKLRPVLSMMGHFHRSAEPEMS
jgi:HPt (histidine-containing phosphotransfer) domain-containing protein